MRPVSRRGRSTRRDRRVVINALGGCCERCGETQHACLTYHHRVPLRKPSGKRDLCDRPLANPSRASLERYLPYWLEAGHLLCEDCHSLVHYYNERRWVDEDIYSRTAAGGVRPDGSMRPVGREGIYNRRVRRVIKDALGGCCERCGETQHACLTYHHRRPVRAAASRRDLRDRPLSNPSFASLERNLDYWRENGHLLCRNCHKLVHYYNEKRWVDEDIYDRTEAHGDDGNQGRGTDELPAGGPADGQPGVEGGASQLLAVAQAADA